MLKAEARWVGRALGEVRPEKLSPLLNIGSATAEFREKIQPWIDSEIFAPLRARGVAVDHLDIQEGAGVDLRGDLADNAFTDSLASRGYRSALCCNLLEHVSDPRSIAAKLERVVPENGFLIVTVPNRFPWHPDPIDTLFRPAPSELSALFSECTQIRGEVLRCGTGWDYVERDPLELIAKVRRRLAGRREHGGVRGTTSFIPWLFRSFRQTCVLLRRDRCAGPNGVRGGDSDHRAESSDTHRMTEGETAN